MPDEPRLHLPVSVPSIEHLPWWGGVYAVSREAFEAPGGWDECRSVIEGHVRRAARAAGHVPVGGVRLAWSRLDPSDLPGFDVHPMSGPDLETLEPDPNWKVWSKAHVRVDPNARLS